MLTIAALSNEYVRIPVAASTSGVDVDPTGDTVALAFVPQDTVPGNSDWKTGSWETDNTSTPPTHYARCIVGPVSGVVTLVSGNIYEIWIKISDSPEVPIKKAGPARVI